LFERFHFQDLISASLVEIAERMDGIMLVVEWIKIPVLLSMGVVAAILAASIIASLMFPHRPATPSRA